MVIIILRFIFIFLLFCFIGYVWEILLYFIKLKKFVNRGNLYGPWLFVYGVGGLFIYYILSMFNNILFIFIFGSLGCGIIEYFISFLEEVIWKKRWWDYSDKFFNINGRVCALSLIFFGFCSAVCVKLFNNYLKLFSVNSYFIILVFLIFLIDLIYSFFRPNVGDNICIDTHK